MSVSQGRVFCQENEKGKVDFGLPSLTHKLYALQQAICLPETDPIGGP